jgi:hypothetical protein
MAARTYRDTDVGLTGAVIKATRGIVSGYSIINAAAAVRYVKLYDKATAPDETDTPKLTIKLEASVAREFEYVDPIQFANGIGIRASNALADSDTTAPTANDVNVQAIRFK